MLWDWVYLCSDPRRLALTMKYLPAWPKQLHTMHICWCSHLDPAKRGQELYTTAVNCMPENSCWVVQDISPDAVEHLPAGLNDFFYGLPNGRPSWALGIKPLLALVFEPPFLYTDDDVLVLKDPQPLIDGYGEFGTRSNFAYQPSLEIQRQIRTVFELDPSFDFGVSNLDEGVLFIRDRRDWADRLLAFSKLPYIKKLKEGCHESRRMGVRFHTAFGGQYNFHQLRTASERKNSYELPHKFSNPLAFTKGTTFFHYMTRDKVAWMDVLKGESE